ncbi:testis-specific serine kinase substrate [Haliaeetus albicilla]|uniref:testis-specific serine kinase substrate n=1 Tax=Haliaeetus albicilla TaxID=8969 RepID=UPI0037E7DF18
MGNAGVKTLLQSTELMEAMDPKSGTPAQPAAPRPLLELGAPQGLTKPAAVSFLGPASAEFPRSRPPPNCCTLKRTFACTNLLLLSLADPDGAADGEASPGPHLHTPCPRDNTESTAPLDYREFMALPEAHGHPYSSSTPRATPNPPHPYNVGLSWLFEATDSVPSLKDRCGSACRAPGSPGHFGTDNPS